MIDAARFTIYGLRLTGSDEVRYIGQTIGSPALRLKGHYASALYRPFNRPLCEWLIANRGSVEAFVIVTAAARGAACVRERVTIQDFAERGDRLFNLYHRPRAIREALKAA